MSGLVYMLADGSAGTKSAVMLRTCVPARSSRRERNIVQNSLDETFKINIFYYFARTAYGKVKQYMDIKSIMLTYKDTI